MTAAELRALRATGLIGAFGALVCIAADLILLYAPIPLDRYSAYTVAPGRPAWRLAVGGLLGVFVIPMILAGFVHLYLALRPAGPWFAVPPVALGAYAYVVGAAFHGAVPLFMAAIQATPPGVSPQASPLVRVMVPLIYPLRAVLAASAMLYAVSLFIAIVSGRTRYPRWAALASPLVLVLGFQLLMRVGPPALIGVLFPAGYNLATFAFLTLSTALLWRPAEPMEKKKEVDGPANRARS